VLNFGVNLWCYPKIKWPIITCHKRHALTFQPSLATGHSLGQGAFYISAINMENKDTKKVIPQYNSFHIIVSIDTVDYAESISLMTLRVDLHLPSTEDFLTVITLKINVNCCKAWFCINGNHIWFFITSFFVTITLLCSRMHEIY